MALVLLLLAACESGTSRTVEILVPSVVANGFDPTIPGIVVTDVAGGATPVAALCGQTEPDPLVVWIDDGFGCLRERAEAGLEVTVHAWAEPGPVLSLDPCTLERDSRGVLPLPSKDRSALATVAESSWPQGSATGVWRRDLSPCGGVLSVSGLTLQ